MPTYHYVAKDADDHEHRGDLEASSFDDAVYQLRKSGWVPQSLTLAGQADRLLFRLTLIGLAVSSMAVLCSLIAVISVLFRNTPKSSASDYDFSSPKAVIESRIQMALMSDLAAGIDYELKVNGAQMREKLKTLKVHQETDWQGKKILFISYDENGTKKHSTAAFEKDTASGYWRDRFVTYFDVDKDNPVLATQMRKWAESGQLDK